MRIVIVIMISFFCLYGAMIDGVSCVVKGEAITLYEVQEQMRKGKLESKAALDILIRQKLEESEIIERDIEVSATEVYEDIKQAASRNNLSVSEFYTAVRESNGLSSTQLKETIKKKLLAQKLYSAIAYSSVSEPSEEEIQAYFEANKDSFTHPSSFSVVIYQSSDKNLLRQKVENPMFYSPKIVSNEQELPYDRITPELANLLERTPQHRFSNIVPDGKGGFMSFYVKEIHLVQESSFESVYNQVKSKIMSQKREQVLGEYFVRLRDNAEVEIIRLP